MKKLGITLAITASLLIAGTALSSGKNTVLAKYDGGNITESDVVNNLALIEAQLPGKKNFEDLDTNTKKELIRGVAVMRLLDEEAKKSKIENTDEYKKQLEIVKRQLAHRKLIESKISESISDSKIKSEYDSFIKEWTEKWGNKEEVHAKHILLSSEDDAKAVLKELSQGKKFEDLAKEKSIDRNKEQGGDLGYFTEGQMIKEFEDAAFALKKGEISKPVKSTFGWHIIKLEDKRKLAKPSYDELKPRIRAELEMKSSREYIDNLINNSHFEYTN